LVRKRSFDDFMKRSTHILSHIAMVGLSAALALSLPVAVTFVARQFLLYWSRIGNDKVFFLSVEIILTVGFIFLSAAIQKSWRDRKLSNMARAAGMVFVTPAKGFFTKRKIRKLKESQGLAREVMVISSTGYRTFVDSKAELHQVIQNCREAKIMLLNPNSEGAVARAKGIPDPAVTPESFRKQIGKTIEFLKLLKAAQKNIRLKLYPDPPFLKMAILGDYIWLQHYQPGLDVQRMPRYVFKHDPNIGSLYFPFYQYFLRRWNNPDLPEYDLETDELVYRDAAGNNTISPLWPHEKRVVPGDSPASSRQNFHGGLHPGGKEFSLLRSRNPICESAGWIALL
jgi:hypothetical protein